MHLELYSYVNVDLGGDLDNHISTSSYIFLYNSIGIL